MSSKLKILQVIPKLGYGGAETGCYDLAHYLHENNCTSFIATSGGDLIKFIDKKLGERNQSAIVNKIGDIKIYSIKCKKNLVDYIENFKKDLI